MRYSTQEAADMSGLSYRQVDHYDRTGLLTASFPSSGSGRKRYYSAVDVRILTVLAKFVRAGLSPSVMERMPDFELRAAAVRGGWYVVVDSVGGRLISAEGLNDFLAAQDEAVTVARV